MQDVQARVDAYLRESDLMRRSPEVTPVAGDASTRRYVRVRFGDGETLVLAVHEGPIDFATLPFANVSALLREIPLPVPAIAGHSDRLGVIALEDVGDLTLQEYLRTADAAERSARYREAITLIERLQRRGAELESHTYIPYGLAFDVEKLTWELAFFTKHFIEGHRGVVLRADERDALSAEWAALAADLASEPRVVCHRDYHSRNLMVHGGRLLVIDFQDARMGPDTYDLVSLLRDAYVEITEDELESNVAWFLKLTNGQDPAAFRRRFDVMTVQRTLKALGTFGFQATARKNTIYLQYVPRTIRYVRGAMERHSRFERLQGILARHVPELQSGYNSA